MAGNKASQMVEENTRVNSNTEIKEEGKNCLNRKKKKEKSKE